MAKKNSSKTATEKAIQSSEPRVTTYRGWKGVNYVDSPLTWEPLEQGPGKYRQSDLPANYLMVQNNLVTTPTLGVETRDDSIVVGKMPDNNGFLTGISDVYRHWLFAVCRRPIPNTHDKYQDVILYRSLLENQDDPVFDHVINVDISGPSEHNPNIIIHEIGFYESNMVATVERESKGYVCLAKVEISSDGTSISIKGMNWATKEETRTNILVNTDPMNDPANDDDLDLAENDWACLEPKGMLGQYWAPDQDDPDNELTTYTRLDIVYCYVNRMGSTLTSYPATVYVQFSPTLWSSSRYLKIGSRDHASLWNDIYDEEHWAGLPTGHRTDPNLDPSVSPNTYLRSVSGIDFYARENENTDYVFIGHINLAPGQTEWTFDWLGNMTDTSQWANSQIQIPTENTSSGPNATHFTSHDSRIYYWGDPSKLYRLYIGGNPGAEFSIARGLGGAWIDIEPGSGYEISGTAKWKTSQGANIVTILCGNRNTNKVKRFNLIETNLTFTNEVSYKSYMYEEVSNVVGCNSRYGYGVYSDGLYCLSRYGLVLTTMAMEYNNQMKTQDISEVIKPIFTERIGDRLRDGRMVCIDNVIYIALSEDTNVQEPINLDNVIICYDIGLQAWYTFTHDQTYGRGPGQDIDKIHHILAIDSDEFIEGLGAITDTQVRLYPTTGIQDPSIPEFQVILETGELIPKMPKQTFDYIEQLEFRFDYFLGPNGDEDDPWNYLDPDRHWTYQDPATILIEGIDYYGRSFEITKYLNFKSRGHHGLEGEQRSYTEWVRVGKLVQSLRIRIKGHARFRLTHIVNKMYTQSDRIGTPYGFDASDSYYNRHRGKTKIHHYINDYNNLRDAVVS